MNLFSDIISTDSASTVTVDLPVLDGGYFDTLVAIGYAKLAESVYAADETVIRYVGTHYQVIRGTKELVTHELNWLRYTYPASWKDKGDKVTLIEHKKLMFKKSSWDGNITVPHFGLYVDTSDDRKITIEQGNDQTEIIDPIRELYGVLNKHGEPPWLNDCIFTCRARALEIVNDNFNETGITFNSIILPQSNKGGNSANSFSIGNTSLPKKHVVQWSREICLAVAGLIIGARGSIQNGFAIPMPLNISIETLERLVQQNRRRSIYRGFFFAFDNYTYYLNLLLLYREELDSERALRAIGGMRLIELGAAASPAGTWQFSIPQYDYSMDDVDRLRNLLRQWRRAVQHKATSTPNINRAAVTQFMRGFEQADLSHFLEGFFIYLSAIDLIKNYSRGTIHQDLIIKIMKENAKNNPQLSLMIESLLGPKVAPFIEVIRQDTYSRAIVQKGKEAKQPDFQMIRKLREVQSTTDLLTALTEISIKRSIDKFAEQTSNRENKMFLNLPTQEGMATLIKLAEEISNPRLVAHTLLALAMSKKDYQEPEPDLDEVSDEAQ